MGLLSCFRATVKKPRDEQTKPRDEQTKPRDEQTKPRDEQKKPRDEQKEPRDEQKKPRDEQKKPHDEQKIPRDEQKEPHAKPIQTRVAYTGPFNSCGPRVKGAVFVMGDGPVYRVESGTTWWLYNDSAASSFEVTVDFGADTQLKVPTISQYRVHLDKLPDARGGTHAVAVVKPAETLSFVTSDGLRFAHTFNFTSLHCVEWLDSDELALRAGRVSAYYGCGPQVEGTVCVIGDGPVYRVESGTAWWLYNDSAASSFEVTVDFDADTQLKVPTISQYRVQMDKLPDARGGTRIAAVVLPYETLHIAQFDDKGVVGAFDIQYWRTWRPLPPTDATGVVAVAGGVTEGAAESPETSHEPLIDVDKGATSPASTKKRRGPVYDGPFHLLGPSQPGTVYALHTPDVYLVTGASEWFFYNDRSITNFHVTVDFGPKTVVEAPTTEKGVTLERDAGAFSGTRVRGVVHPAETIRLVTFAANAKIDMYAILLACKLLSSGYTKKREQRVDKVRSRDVSRAGKFMQTNDVKTASEVLHECVKKTKLFVDPRFRPCMTSLKDTRTYTSNISIVLSSVMWTRPVDLVPASMRQKVGLFTTPASPTSVVQGQIGNCYLMSQITGLAAHAHMCEDMFRHPVDTHARQVEWACGASRVWLCIDGWYTSVIVDTYLPCIGRNLCFAECEDGLYSLWVPLLEKALAKVSGSYTAIIGGNTDHCERALSPDEFLTGFCQYHLYTGNPAQDCNDDNKLDDVTKRLERRLDRGTLITASIDEKPSRGKRSLRSGKQSDSTEVLSMQGTLFREDYVALGLVTHHDYSVLGVHRPHGWRTCLVKLRNTHHGSQTWKGTWSNNDAVWSEHPDIKAACQPNSKDDDGTFWMALGDVLRFFSTLNFRPLRPRWVEYRVRGSSVGSHFSVLRIDVSSERDLRFFISLKMSTTGSDTSIALVLSQRHDSVKGGHQTTRHRDVAQPWITTSSISRVDDDEDKTEWQAAVREAAFDDEEHCNIPDLARHVPSNFVHIRTLEMACVLSRRHSPYFVLPLTSKINASLKYVVAACCPEAAGLSTYNISFAQLERENSSCVMPCVFRSNKPYVMPVSAEFQSRVPGQAPINYQGECVLKGTALPPTEL